MTNIEINTPFIKLQQFLKFSNVLSSGGEAKNVIIDGYVLVNGEVCTQRGKKIYPGDVVQFEDIILKAVALSEE